MKERIELPVKEIVRKWENGITQGQLAKEYGVSIQTINSRIKEYYEKEGKEKPKKEKKKPTPRIQLPIEEIVEKWENGALQRELAEEYQVSVPLIRSRTNEYYQEKGKEKPKKKEVNPKIELPIEQIIKDMEEGMSYQKLEVKYGVSNSTIRKRLNEYYREKGQENPHKNEVIEKIELPIEKIVKKWESGATQKVLAEEYGVSATLIANRIREYTGNTNNKKKEVPVEEIIEKRKNGATVEGIAAEYGVSSALISNRIRQYYEKKGEEIPKDFVYRIELPVEEIIEKHQKGKTVEEIAKEYGVTTGAISKRITNYYNSSEAKGTKILKRTGIIVKYLKKGLTPEQIQEIALKSKIIIPEEIMQKAIAKVEGSKTIRTKQGTDR